MPSTRKPKPTPAALVAQAEARCQALAAERAQAVAAGLLGDTPPRPVEAVEAEHAEALAALQAAKAVEAEANAAANAEREADRAARSRRILDEDARVRAALQEAGRKAYAAREEALEGLDLTRILDVTADYLATREALALWRNARNSAAYLLESKATTNAERQAVPGPLPDVRDAAVGVFHRNASEGDLDKAVRRVAQRRADAVLETVLESLDLADLVEEV